MNSNMHRRVHDTTTASPAVVNNDTVPKRRQRRLVKKHRNVIDQVRNVLIIITLVLVAIASLIYLLHELMQLANYLAQGDGAQQYRRGSAGRHKFSDRATEGDDYEVLPWNPIYRIPEAMATVGDRSTEYAILRKDIDARLDVSDLGRSLKFVQDLTSNNHQYLPIAQQQQNHHSDQLFDSQAADVSETYDIYNCPETPPAGYPYQWKTTQILENWPTDDTTPRSHIHQGLCVFDFEQDYNKAMTYRQAEVPFVVINDPQVLRTVERWNTPGYMPNLMGDVQHRCEYSENNHFMYWVPLTKRQKRKMRQREQDDGQKQWKEPTELLHLSYNEWLQHANITDETQLGPDKPHWYFRLIGCGYMGTDGSCDHGSSEYLFDELPFFQPKHDLLYIVEPEEQKGIHCRFGMKGVIAENHFDGSRNAIVVLGGQRRYILSHPNQCENLALYPKGHPSARHSAVDWSNPDFEQFPQFKQAMSNEIVLQPGHVLYLPTNWFHYIVSLDLNFQCNTRSGVSSEYMSSIHQCGF